MDYLIQGDTLSEIADAIRGKTGNQAAIAVKNMASQIDSIQAGGGGSGAAGRSVFPRSRSLCSGRRFVGQLPVWACWACRGGAG